MFLEYIKIHYNDEVTLRLFAEHFYVKATFTSEINGLLCFYTENQEFLIQCIFETWKKVNSIQRL